MCIFLREDGIERFLQQFAVFHAVHRDVLAAVVHPEVHDAGVALALSHLFGNGAAAAGVFNPEVADALVRVGEGEVARFGMGEGGGVEVELHVVLLCPLHPAFEVAGLHLVAVHELSAEFPVDFVQAQAMASGNEGRGFKDVGPQLLDVARPSGIVAGGLDAAGQCAARLEAGHVVGLPAVKREGDALQGVQNLVCGDAQCGIAFACHVVGLLNQSVFHKL